MAKPKNIYIVEDIAISRMSLETMLLQNGHNVVGSAAKAEVAWNEIKKKPIDLILLDINLAGEKNGIWLAQQIRKYLNTPIIYLTAFSDQQTLKNVLDTKPNGYLMKPYQEATLLTTIDIALSSFLENQKNINLLKTETTSNNFIFIKDKFMKIKINTDDIYYVKSDGNYLEIKLHNKRHVIRHKLLDFKTKLPDTIFFQSHQRYLINISKVCILKTDAVILDNEKLPLSLKYKAALQNAISNL